MSDLTHQHCYDGYCAETNNAALRAALTEAVAALQKAECLTVSDWYESERRAVQQAIAHAKSALARTT